MVDLTHIELATEEDKNSHLEKTITRVKILTEDEKLRMIAEARQDQIMQLNDFNEHYQEEIAARNPSCGI